MSLETTIADITHRLRRNGYPNEQAISQGIVLRLLQELGWNTFDTNVVWPEYQTGEGRADFALCHPPSKPAVVIEVKNVGKADGAVRQALQYAFHCGVPFVVLTDGRFWSFYLPAAQGDYQDRRICQIDLFDLSADDVATIFLGYLSHENVASGRSLKAAQDEYDMRSRRSRVMAAMPDVWREIVELRNSEVLKIFSDAVASEVGYEPDLDDVTHFIRDRLMISPGAILPRKELDPTSRRNRHRKASMADKIQNQTTFGVVRETPPGRRMIEYRDPTKRDSWFAERSIHSRQPRMR